MRALGARRKNNCFGSGDRMTNRGLVGLLLAGLFAATGVQAQAPAGQLEISGTSTVRSWKCTDSEFKTTLEASANFEDQVLAGQKAVDRVALTFPVAKIDCHNGTMDEHMEKALKEKQHPTIHFSMKAYDIGQAVESGEVPAKVSGEMTIAGQTKPVELQVAISKAADGGLRVQGTQDLKMTDFGVKPPTLFFGTLKVGDAVHVKFDLVLRASTVALLGISRPR